MRNAALPQGAWETSQSGRGLHCIIKVPDKAAFESKRNKFNGVECYATKRFMAIGGGGWSSDNIATDTTGALLCMMPDRDDRGSNAGRENWADIARPGYSGTADDDELIDRMLSAVPRDLTALGHKVSVIDLWQGNPAVLGKFFPDEGGSRPFDNSAAELALADRLAYWTGCNPVRMERLMCRAPLCQREKFQSRDDYRARTINAAIGDDPIAHI